MCGRERWPVKILADKDREQVELAPIETTIAKLSSVPRHNIPYPYDHRIGPEELKVYRIKAKLLRVRLEQDSTMSAAARARIAAAQRARWAKVKAAQKKKCQITQSTPC